MSLTRRFGDFGHRPNSGRLPANFSALRQGSVLRREPYGRDGRPGAALRPIGAGRLRLIFYISTMAPNPPMIYALRGNDIDSAGIEAQTGQTGVDNASILWKGMK